MSTEKVRLSLDLSQELNETLDRLAAEGGTTKSELLRKAIALVDVATQAKQKHQKLAIVDEQEHVISQIVGL
ncbi:MAG: CopG family transcriptional regulator [Pyrinomonadaceae bacterium]